MGRHGDSGMLVCLGVSLGQAALGVVVGYPSPLCSLLGAACNGIVDPGASQANYGVFQVAFRSG